MSAHRLDPNNFRTLFAALRQRYTLWAPVRQKGRGRFSDTDCIRYQVVERPDQVEWLAKSDFSAKEVAFPPVDAFSHSVGGTVVPVTADTKPLLIFLRSCDIHAFERCDSIFLGKHPDARYGQRRERIRFALIDCAKAFDNCFCRSMGTNQTSNWDLAFAPDSTGGAIVSSKVEGLIPTSAAACQWQPDGPPEDGVPVQLPDPARLEKAIQTEDFFDHPLWEEYSRRCIACGRCNFSCPTCTCFSTVDVVSDQAPLQSERRRLWAGCHVDRFTDMAGGHAFRKTYGARMRYKVMHKIHDFHRRFGKHMCIGCGRCDDQCPEYISLSSCINKISEHFPMPTITQKPTAIPGGLTP